jgi:nitroreductase
MSVPLAVLDDLVAAAVLAPSSHNTQPWRFVVGNDTIELRADRSRRLPINDPSDRELTISCGAALFNLRVAAAFANLTSNVSIVPDAGNDGVLATVRLRSGGDIDASLVPLFGAIGQRHTYRGDVSTTDDKEQIVQSLIRAARAEGVDLAVLGSDERVILARLVGQGDRCGDRFPQVVVGLGHPRGLPRSAPRRPRADVCRVAGVMA